MMIRDGNKTSQEIEEDEERGGITSGNPKYKEKYQLDTIKNVKNLRDSRQKIIDLFNDSARIRSKAIYKSKQNKPLEQDLKY